MRTYGRQGSVALLAARLTEAAALGPVTALDRVRQVAEHGQVVATAAAAASLSRALELLWQRGWLPAEAVAAVPKALTALVTAAIGHECRRYPTARLHPVWRTQLAELDGTPIELTEPLVPSLSQVVELVSVLMALPQLPRLVPGPCEAAEQASGPAVDPRVMIKVRGLLAKAESTPFAAEAEALSAKAQELMSRYAFEQAVITADHPQQAAARRMWLSGPYQVPKAQLVDAVATANRCRSVFYPRLGCVGLVGHETDLEITELLAASLATQSTRAMAHAPGRTRAYRHAFLVAYAHRVHQRLTEAAAHVRPTATALVPALASREAAVEAKFTALYPGIRTRRTTATNPSGWTAGLAAADQADLHPHRRVAS
ncbi:hypothetical protein JOD54_001528 [Actinokineospora baliensis]|uniref:DUF2786 domain-containing protein n=1 Tax=Actinokineospora baliensis TaxID=547056 RepID=UPI0023BAA25F|nr:DUF2786 domain-containing protein [Actinokineospora baliensis]MBM7771324.1 hypothetical protein [Actinokineospora baliensis]